MLLIWKIRILEDKWHRSGGFLICQNQSTLLDFTAIANLDDSYTDGLFDLVLEYGNTGGSDSELQTTVQLLDNGREILSFEEKIELPAGGTKELKFSEQIPNVHRWTAETPHLYTLVIEWENEDGATEATSRKIGFRRIEIKNAQFLVNGVPVYLKGVNHHDHDPVKGHVIDEAITIKDLELMKQNNINAIRCSHYPKNPFFYELTDKYGFYVIDEANIEIHGMGTTNQGLDRSEKRKKVHPAYLPQWKAMHLDRTIRMFERDKNYTSIVIWSLGNEAGNGENFFATYDWLKKSDPTRPVQYEGATRYENSDIQVPMYARIQGS